LISAIFSRFFGVWVKFAPRFPRKALFVRSISDRNSLAARIKSEQEAPGRRDHCHAETSARVSLGTTSRLAEIIERTMHVKSSIADTEQNCRTL
jgi:hypothetical protein